MPTPPTLRTRCFLHGRSARSPRAPPHESEATYLTVRDPAWGGTAPPLPVPGRRSTDGRLRFFATTNDGSSLARRCSFLASRFLSCFRFCLRLQFRGLQPLGRFPQAYQIVKL